MFLDNFKEIPKRKILYIVTLISFITILIIEIFIFLPIESLIPTYGIIDYEFVWNASNVLIIFSIWGTEWMNIQIIAIYWDFLFILGYVSLAFSLIILVYQKSNKQIQTIGKFILLTPFLTGIFDIIENVFLLVMLINPLTVTNINAFMASFSATIKFGLLFSGIIYFIGALTIIIINKFKKKKKEAYV